MVDLNYYDVSLALSLPISIVPFAAMFAEP